MNPKIFSQRLFYLPAALSVWVIVSVFAALWVDPDTFYLSAVLLVFTSTLAALNVFSYSGWFAAVISVLIYGLVQIGLKGFNISVFLTTGVLTVELVIAAWIGWASARETERMTRQLNQDQKLIAELRVYDPETSLLNYQHVMRTLRTEVIRSQRYNKNVCLLLIQIENPKAVEDELGVGGLEQARRRVAELLSGSVRAMDIPFSGDRVGVILPETNSTGAQTVIQRILDGASHKTRLALNIGVAQFPTDGVTENELMRAADAALQVSQTTGQPYVSYSQVQEAAKTAA